MTIVQERHTCLDFLLAQQLLVVLVLLLFLDLHHDFTVSLQGEVVLLTHKLMEALEEGVDFLVQHPLRGHELALDIPPSELFEPPRQHEAIEVGRLRRLCLLRVVHRLDKLFQLEDLWNRALSEGNAILRVVKAEPRILSPIQ